MKASRGAQKRSCEFAWRRRSSFEKRTHPALWAGPSFFRQGCTGNAKEPADPLLCGTVGSWTHVVLGCRDTKAATFLSRRWAGVDCNIRNHSGVIGTCQCVGRTDEAISSLRDCFAFNDVTCFPP